MKRSLAVSTIFALLPLAGQPVPSNPAAVTVLEDTKKSQKQTAGKDRSMTGCVDEQDGRYVLAEEETLRPIAVLEAQSFPQEGFAKHVGHKVTVRGSITSTGDRTVMRVRSIQKVSEKCAPPNEN